MPPCQNPRSGSNIIHGLIDARWKMTDDKKHEEDEEGLVELISVQGEMTAQVIIGLLESEGIEAMMKSNQTFSALPFTVDGMGAVRIMVRKEDLEKARKVLEDYSHGDDEVEALLKEALVDWKPPEGQSN
jgi:hypothetical protein